MATYNDSFTGENQNPLGGNWVTVTGCQNLQRYSNACHPTVATALNAAYYNDTFSANQYSKLKWTIHGAADYYSSVIARTQTDAQTFYQAYITTTSIIIRKCVAGEYTAIGSGFAGTYAVEHTWKLSISGTSPGVLEAFYDDVSVGDEEDASISSGYAGIWFWCHFDVYSEAVDDWEGGDLEAGGRTTKNTDPWGLGMCHGMSFRMV